MPREWEPYLDNVAVVVEDEPPHGEDLFGLFEGAPLSEPGTGLLPCKISLYRGPLERSCATRWELEQEIRRTLWHEVGHYLGLEEHELEALEQPEAERRTV